MGAVEIEEVVDRRQRRRFHDLAVHAGRDQPGFAPPVLSLETWRLDRAVNPFFETGDALVLLARSRGRPSGRLTVQTAPDAEGTPIGWFGFPVIPDAEVLGALLDVGVAWLADRGCATVEGPVSLSPGEDWGARTDGFEHGAATGIPWQPPGLDALLRGLGFDVAHRIGWLLVPPDGEPPLPSLGELGPPLEAASPDWLGAWRSSFVEAAGSLVVPDVVDALQRVGLRSAWSAARAARQRRWRRAVVARLADPSDRAAALSAAATAGVDELWVPVDVADASVVNSTFRRAT